MRAGLQNITCTNITVGSSSTVVLTAADTTNPHLLPEIIILGNDSDEDIYIAIGAAAVMNQGILLKARGGSIAFAFPTVPYQAINAICSSGSKNLVLTHGN